MMTELLAMLQQRQLSLSACESLTGGLFASEFVAVPHVSTVFKGGIVCYQDEIKINVVGIDADLIAKFGAVSRECVQAMLVKTQHMFHTDCCVAFSGNAGPAPSEDKPVGLVYFGARIADTAIVREVHYENVERNALRNKIVADGVELLLEMLRNDVSNYQIDSWRRRNGS